ncbi:MAG: hypothetical protein L0K86_29310 [Actinomycetia bacterium]|nr:hypothetical protein [Actinomycetes bacterium]
MSNNRIGRVCPSVAVVVLTAALLSACGGEADGGTGANNDGANPDNQEAPATEVAFCDQIDGIEETLDLVTAMDEVEPADVTAHVDAAASLFDTAEPPTKIESDWAETERFVRLLDDALGDADPANEQELQDAFDEEASKELIGALMSVQGSATKVGAYVQSECGVDLGVQASAVSDACTLLEGDDVADAFDGEVPEPESRPYGNGTAECIWSDDSREVGVTIMPAKTLRKEYLRKSTPLDAGVPGVPGGHAFMGVFGIGRFSTDGHTVSFVAGKQGGLASVKLGPDGDQRAEIDLASELAGTLVEGLQS